MLKAPRFDARKPHQARRIDFARVLLPTHVAVAADSAHVEVAHSRGGLSLRTAARARTGLIVAEAARAFTAGWLKCRMDQHGTPPRCVLLVAQI